MTMESQTFLKWLRMRKALFLLVLPATVAFGGSDAQNTVASTSAVRTDFPQQGTKATTITWNNKIWKNRINEVPGTLDMMETENDDNLFDATSNDRDLRSDGSNSRDSHDGDDFWRNPDYWDDYVGHNRDDDFYKYIGDPLPPSLSTMTRRDVIGFMVASLGATLGSIGGIGAGGLVVPCYIIVSGLAPRFAMPLGAVTVLGGSIAGLLLNLRRRHPLADRPIIDWDLMLVMGPLVLVGTLIGSILHRVISEKILTVLLVLLLSIVAHTTLAKAKRMYDAERRYIEHLKSARSDYLSRVASFRTAFRMSEAGWSADALAGMDPESKASSYHMPHSPVRTTSIDSRSTAYLSPRMNIYERQRILILNPDFVTLRSDLLEQEKITPRSKVMAVVVTFSVLMVLNISLGGGAFASPLGIECGGVAFWVVQVIMIAFLVSSAWAAQTYLVNRHELKEIVRFDYVHGDIKWEPRTAVVYPCFFIIAGLSAGMFGIGGGMITVPLMLAMGVHPAICMATSSTMGFFTVLLTTSSFAIFNLILWDYAAVGFAIGFFSSLMGQGLMQVARQTSTGATNFERNSFIAYCIGGVIMLCALLMTLQYVVQIVGFNKEKSYTEGGLCEGYRM